MQSDNNDPRHSDLHKLIKKHYNQVIRDKALQGKALPFHIKREFERYLTCGVPVHGMVVLKLKSSYTDGTTHLRFTPQAFIKRIISLIPKPRTNMVRYHGVFAPRHKKRAEITSLAKSSKPKKKNQNKKVQKTYQTPWAELLKRVFLKEVDNCDSCGSKIKYVASITSPIQCRKILDHLKMDQEIIEGAPTRGSPMEEILNPDYEDFDQTANW